MSESKVCSSEEILEIKKLMHSNDDLVLASSFFKSFSDPTRLTIVNALYVHGALCVSDLCEILNMSKSAVSHQLSKLRRYNLVKIRNEGRRVFYALSDSHVKQVFAMTMSHIKEEDCD